MRSQPLFAGAGCKKKAVDPFPASGAVAGWEKTSETRVFAAKDLWQYIDGDAEQYIRPAWFPRQHPTISTRASWRRWSTCTPWAIPPGAHKILEKSQSKDAKTVSLGDAGIAYAQSVTFRKGPNLVRIVAYESTPGAQQALIALAHGVEAKL